MTSRPAAVQVKICGLTRVEDVRLAAAAGADYAGVILSAGFRRSLDAGHARTLRAASALPFVGVVVDESPAAAARLARDADVDVLQLHGDEPPEALLAIRDEGPWRLWKAVRPRTATDVLEAFERFSGVADALLLDGSHPGLRGGAGTPFAWSVLDDARERLPPSLELVVAGGLTPRNVAEAVVRLRPHVVDVSSGVEARPGAKDPDELRAFVAAARGERACRTRGAGRRDRIEGRP